MKNQPDPGTRELILDAMGNVYDPCGGHQACETDVMLLGRSRILPELSGDGFYGEARGFLSIARFWPWREVALCQWLASGGNGMGDLSTAPNASG